MSKETWIKAGMNTLVASLAAAIPVGAFMGFYTGNNDWFWLCLPIIIFLS